MDHMRIGTGLQVVLVSVFPLFGAGNTPVTPQMSTICYCVSGAVHGRGVAHTVRDLEPTGQFPYLPSFSPTAIPRLPVL